MSVTFDHVIPSLRIFDVAKTREFYLDFLGCKLDFEHRFEPDLPLFMQVSLGPVKLYLSEHHGEGSPGSRVTIAMTGLAEYHAALLAKRYGYARPGLQKQPWGETTMTIADPFYNHICFKESAAATSA